MKNLNLLSILIYALAMGTLHAQTPKVHNTGSMKDMGNTYDLHILLDTISPKSHLYGMGPYDRMKGEITVIDGKPYFATAFEEGKYQVDNDWDIRSPFFVYADVKEWKVFKITSSFNCVEGIQDVVASIAKAKGYDLKQPFPFMIKGPFDELTAHIVTPRNPEVEGYREGVKSQKFTFEETEGELVGFYSENHQGVFTHADSFVHIHYLKKDKTFMGHLDEIKTKSSSYKLYLPKRK
ncbi:MAG: acetolactate decarboxylase [Bacteroidota bacterium]|nr:acetolactate decarboxylase [Bacteroidota bacterium]